jgi:hypothetical protein
MENKLPRGRLHGLAIRRCTSLVDWQKYTGGSRVTETFLASVMSAHHPRASPPSIFSLRSAIQHIKEEKKSRHESAKNFRQIYENYTYRFRTILIIKEQLIVQLQRNRAQFRTVYAQVQ